MLLYHWRQLRIKIIFQPQEKQNKKEEHKFYRLKYGIFSKKLQRRYEFKKNDIFEISAFSLIRKVTSDYPKSAQSLIWRRNETCGPICIKFLPYISVSHILKNA